MSYPIIQVKNLVKKFDKVKAVNGVSFSIEEGKITGLLGPNGAGKTTTIQMLLDIISPTSGEINIFGKDLHENREEILNKMNFSSPYVSLPGNLKVWENLYTFARLYGVKDYKNKVKELSKTFEIDKMMEKMTYNLSTGQLTRLNLAKAMINDPKLLLLDEPTASLDPDIADKTINMLKKIQEENKVTILYTSHNMAEVEKICDRIIFINNGKIIDDGKPKDLIKKHGRKDLNEVFLHLARNGDKNEE